MSVVRGLFKNAAWLSIGRMGSKLLRGVFLVFAARFLGVAPYGVVIYALAQSGIFTALADSGLNQLSMRECARGTLEGKREIASAGFFIKLILIGIASAILFVTMFFGQHIVPVTIDLIIFVIIIFAFDSLKDYTAGLMISQEKNRTEALITISANIIPIGIGIPYLYFHPTALSLLQIYTVSSFIGITLDLYAVYKTKLLTISALPIKKILSILKESYIFGLHSFTSMLVFGIDVILIGYLINEHAVGIYSAAQRIPIILISIPGFIAQGFFPALARTALSSREHTAHIVNKALSFLLLISLPLFIGCQLVAADLIPWLFGALYHDSILPFRILITLCFFSFPNSILTLTLFAFNKQKRVVGISTIAGIGAIVLNYVFIPIGGIIASSIIGILMLGLQNILLTHYLKKEITIKLEMPLIATIVGLLVMTVVILGLLSMHLNNIFVIIGAVTAYGFCMFTSFKKLIHT